MVSEAENISGKGRAWRMMLGAVALGTVIAGAASVPSAKADGWGRDHRGDRVWVRDDYRDNRWFRERQREEWRRHEWRERHRYDGYYNQPRVYYPQQGYYPARSTSRSRCADRGDGRIGCTAEPVSRWIMGLAVVREGRIGFGASLSIGKIDGKRPQHTSESPLF